MNWSQPKVYAVKHKDEESGQLHVLVVFSRHCQTWFWMMVVLFMDAF